MNDFPVHVPRSFRTKLSDIRPFIGTIRELSFHIYNMGKQQNLPIIRLSRKTAFGTVSVLRVNNVEYITVTGTESVMRIILSSAENESYGIDFVLSPNEVTVASEMSKISIPVTSWFAETYVDPVFDLRDEICYYLFSLDHTSFIAVINGGPIFHTVTKVRDDWHNNNFTNSQDYNTDQRPQDYYHSCTQRYVNAEVTIAFSFSPLTFQAGLSHISRYIDHAKRLFTPILGRGDTFETNYPEFSKCENLPYGKKPFTVTSEGIATYREVVKIDKVVPIQNPLSFILFCYWPFVPYLHEISYLNLQWLNLSYGELPLKASLQNINTFQSYKMSHEGGSSALREDVVEGDFPEAQSSNSYNSTFNLAEGIVNGTSFSIEEVRQTKTYNVKKSASIGSVGNLKDLFIETELNGLYSYLYNYDNEITRSSNFPAVYYMPEFVDDSFWDVGSWVDTSIGHSNMNAKYSNIITGKQELKCGDVVLESGAISMRYEGENDEKVTHSGVSAHSRIYTPLPCPLDIYTTPGWETWTPEQPTRNNIVHGVYLTFALASAACDALDTGYSASWSYWNGGGRGYFVKFENTGAPYTDHYWMFDAAYVPCDCGGSTTSGPWIINGTRTDNNIRSSLVNRDIVCFEILDYDSSTYINVGGEHKYIVALIYKKVTITHQQERRYELAYTNPDAGNFKDTTGIPAMPLWYLDPIPAKDDYSYNGTRSVEYKLCLLIDSVKTVIDLGTVNISVSGSFRQSGTDKELKEGGADPAGIDTYKEERAGPVFSVTGNRLYGVSVNCGQAAVTYSFDVEQRNQNTIAADYDSPSNIEDDNSYWEKTKRVVGAMNYYGIHDSKDFPYGTSGTAGFPDTVMAVSYMEE